MNVQIEHSLLPISRDHQLLAVLQISAADMDKIPAFMRGEIEALTSPRGMSPSVLLYRLADFAAMIERSGETRTSEVPDAIQSADRPRAIEWGQDNG